MACSPGIAFHAYFLVTLGKLVLLGHYYGYFHVHGLCIYLLFHEICIPYSIRECFLKSLHRSGDSLPIRQLYINPLFHGNMAYHASPRLWILLEHSRRYPLLCFGARHHNICTRRKLMVPSRDTSDHRILALVDRVVHRFVVLG